MADTNHTRRDDFAGFSDNDPFAELTRIMGHDPRAPQAAAQQETPDHARASDDAFEDDFDIDLEQELMGDFALDDPEEEPQPVQAAPSEPVWPEEAPSSYEPEPVARYPEEANPSADGFAHSAAPANEPDFAEFEAEFDAIASKAVHSDDQPREEAPAFAAPVSEASYEDEDLGSALERELMAGASDGFDVEPAQSDYEPAPVVEETKQSSYEPAFVPQWQDELPAAREETAAPSYAETAARSYEDSAEPAYAETAVPAYEDNDAPSYEETPAPLYEDTSAAAYDDRTVPSYEENTAPAYEEAASPTYESSSTPAYDDDSWDAPEEASLEPVSDPAPVAAASGGSTLEDELNALLAEEPKPAASSTWPLASSFGRANFAAVKSQAATPAAATDYQSSPTMETSQPTFDAVEPEVFETPEADFEPSEDKAPVHGSALLAEDDFDDIFGNDFDLESELSASAETYDEVEAETPEEASQPTTLVSPDISGLAALAAWQPEQERVAQPAIQTTQATGRAAPEDIPEIETVELTEAAQALEDDLDIPDVAYETPAATTQYTDLDSEIAEAFGDLSLDEPEPAPVTASSDTAWTAAAPAAIAGAGAVAYGAAHAAQPAANQHTAGYTDPSSYNADQWQDKNQLSADEFDFDADLDQAIAMASYEDDATHAAASGNSGGRDRMIKIAAIVGGIVLLGGVGVFGMSYVGGGSDGPAIVRADADPMKVRPENPGGATVPNQDNQVYQRVASGEPEPAPEQERLISSAEEPVDVTVQADEPDMLPPGISGDFADGAEETALLQPKAEDRIEQETETAALGGENDATAVVAPRRVRTMVVRPDGTMVPREEVEPAAQPQSVEQQIAAAPLAGQSAGFEAGAAQLVPSEDGEGGPVVNTPDTVSVVPSQRTEPGAAAPAIAQRPAAQIPAQTQTPAAMPVSAPAAAAPVGAATSEWSMQIASQPTAEGAQSTYQDLARRYGSVLEGRGVNVVRADIQGMGTYYRVRIPASNRDEAIQLCTRYKAAGGSCFVSR